jgi:hypothetical protein
MPVGNPLRMLHKIAFVTILINYNRLKKQK